MVPLLALWLPILLSAVAVFIVSSLLHTVLKWHKSDFRQLPGEEQVAAALRPIPAGEYVMPYAASSEAMKDPAYQERLQAGPVGLIRLRPAGPWSMAPQLVQWFGYSVLVGIFAGYVAGRTLGPDAEYLEVFRIVGTTAFASYSLALLQDSIWYWRSWRTTMKNVFDGLIYALITAGMFGWLW